MGITYVNAYFALTHFGNPQASFKDEMRKLSMHLMHNPIRAAELAAMYPSPVDVHIDTVRSYRDRYSTRPGGGKITSSTVQYGMPS